MKHIGSMAIIKKKGDAFSFDERNYQRILLYPSLKAHEKMNKSQRKRTFLFSSCSIRNLVFIEKKPFHKGSMTLEGSLVLPLFLFFMMTILMGLEIVRLQSNVWAGLCQVQGMYYDEQLACRLLFEENEIPLREEGVSKYLDTCENGRLCLLDELVIRHCSDLDGKGKIELWASYQIKPFIWWLPLSKESSAGLIFEDRLLVHAFTGYRGPIEGTNGLDVEEYVYITEYGSHYHQRKDCVSLGVKIEAVSAQELSAKRNNSGGRYASCERCHPQQNGFFYITADGDRYHGTSACPALKRTVRIVSLDEAIRQGKVMCKKCSG